MNVGDEEGETGYVGKRRRWLNYKCSFRVPRAVKEVGGGWDWEMFFKHPNIHALDSRDGSGGGRWVSPDCFTKREVRFCWPGRFQQF